MSLYPHEQQILIDGYELTSFLNEANGNLDTTSADRTTFGDAGWMNESTVTKNAGYSITGFSELDTTSVDRALLTALGDASVVSVYKPGQTGGHAETLVVRKSNHEVSRDVTSWSMFSISLTPARDALVGLPFAFGKVLIPVTDFSAGANGTPVDFGAQSAGVFAVLHITAAGSGIRVSVKHADAQAGPFTNYLNLYTGSGYASTRSARFQSTTALKRYARADVLISSGTARIACGLFKRGQ